MDTDNVELADSEMYSSSGIDYDGLGLRLGGVDFELDEAVRKVLDTTSDTASQSSESSVDEDEISIFSDSRSVRSTKSAIQIRLESWKRPIAPTAEEFQHKLNAASMRRESSLSFIAQRASEHYQEAKTVARQLEDDRNMNLVSKMQKLEKKLLEVEKRKNDFHQGIMARNKTRLERISSFKSQQDAQVQSIQKKTDMKHSLAAQRKEAHMNEKSAKVAAYLSVTLQRGQEAKKKKEEATITNEECSMVESEPDDFINIKNNHCVDESSITAPISSTTSRKRNIQIRLEQWERPTSSRDLLVAKLNAASQRKVDFISSKIEKAVGSRSKVEDKNAIEERKVSEIQKKLENKLLAALERREKIIASKVEKAGNKNYYSVDHGQSALKQKELFIENLGELDSVQDRRKYLRELEKEKRKLNLMRRLMSKTIYDQNDETLQEKLERKLEAARERKKNILAAKVSRAAEHVSSISEKGLDIVKQREISERKLINKLELAAKRKAELEATEVNKREIRRKRREHALEVARKKKLEKLSSQQWESQSLYSEILPAVDETLENGGLADDETSEDRESNNDDNSIELDVVDLNEKRTEEEEEEEEDYLGNVENESTYEDQKSAARRLLAEEIRIANQVKRQELAKISEERKQMETIETSMKDIMKPNIITQSDKFHMSNGTIGSIDTNSLCSFDEEDVSISGMSAIHRAAESNNEERKARTARALAELDVKLSEIQILQAILLAEEASLSGASEFRTSNKSISDLDNVKITTNGVDNGDRVENLKKSARNFFSFTLKSAKAARVRAGKTIVETKTKIMLKNKDLFKRGI